MNLLAYLPILRTKYTLGFDRIRVVFGSIVCLFLPFSSCKKFVEIDVPFTSINGANVYTTDASAIAVLNGLYANLSQGGSENPITGPNSISLLSGLSADEYAFTPSARSTILNAYYTNKLLANASSDLGSDYWSSLYTFIFSCNSALEGLNSATGLTPQIQQQLIGECKFMRAFFYFYLVNCFGNVPLVLNTDYKSNELLASSSTVQVYNQIVADLRDAEKLLNDNYLDASLLNISSERVRPNKTTATALLARVYLYTGDWINAEAYADSVINKNAVYSLNDLNSTFLRAGLGNNEAIWQLQPVNAGWNTEDARIFVLPSTGPDDIHPVYLSKYLLNSFEAGDQRMTNWVDSVTPGGPGNITYYYPNKYKSDSLGAPVSEYLMVMRLAEQYLIRAEARVQLQKISEAQNDIDTIRSRAGLPPTIANDKASLLAAILHERQVELFSEWGNRWLDIKRTGVVHNVMDSVCTGKGGIWQDYQALYPIQYQDLQKAPNLIQNPGYN